MAWLTWAIIRARMVVKRMLSAIRTVYSTASRPSSFTSLLGTASSSVHCMILGPNSPATLARALSSRAAIILNLWRLMYCIARFR